MTLAMGLGLGFALIVGVLIWIAARANSKNCKYDERQVAAQGKAYKAGFVTFIGWEIVEFFIELFTGEPFMPFAPGTLRVIEMLVCIFVYLEVSIFTDAYFPTGKPFNKAWCFIMLFLGATYFLQFFTSKNKSEKVSVLAVGIFIVITMASIIIKQIINKKAEAAEEKESEE
jgi:hypothetical protein